MNTKHRKEYRPKQAAIKASLLLIDSSYQRDTSKARIDHLAACMDLDALGVFHVSRRKNGALYVVDGQHRLEALRSLELLDWVVTAEVYDGLDVGEEADLYRRLNDTKRLNRWDMFKAGLVAGTEEPTMINAICESFGLKVTQGSGDACVSCIDTLERLYRRDRGLLENVLRIVIEAWGKGAAGFDATILKGIASVVRDAGEDLEAEAFVRSLAKAPGGALGIIGRARGLRAAMPTKSIGWCAAKVMIERYNIRRGSNRIEIKES